ncbi:hypothetical protein EXIGLDRAFT_731102 [Exidia glandulosa HHB12029]|uniref:Uncharacterized protein n=1 Tax=Exidia glandulosa HHB12029 TaxID=1314781 RepID=A0A165C0D4_EXIGL|nr:hypothetical protein EXIGLDRAFT_731102 [Exidia glandulosa HHB12029]
MPAIHATLAAAHAAVASSTMTTSPGASGHSTPTTPRAGTPIGALSPAMATPTPA